MAELLAAISIPQVLAAAYEFIQFALEEIDAVEERKSHCKLVLQRCTDLVDEIARHNADGTLPDAFRRNVVYIESACRATYAAIHELSGRHFLWRVTHKGAMDDVLKSAEEAIYTACTKFNIGAHADAYRFRQEFIQIQREEADRMDQLFERLMQRPDEMVVELQKDGQRTIRIEELAISLTKFIQSHQDTSSLKPDDLSTKFLKSATYKVQQLSGINQTIEIPSWSVTTMEVRIDRKERIGRGGFGSIYRGEWNGEIVAVKEMHQDDARMIDRQKMRAVRREISIWSNLRNPHILTFYGACLEAAQPFILTQFCKHGNVLDYIQKNPDVDRLRVLHEISLGMYYLHDKRVIHSDLKAANILIADDGKALITDFGLSRLQDQVSSRDSINVQDKDTSPAGSLRWMSPERLSGEPDTFASDVYSYAVTAWEIFSGEPPFSLMPNALVLATVRDRQDRPKRPTLLTSDSLWELIELCWHAEPTQRPSFKSIQSRLKPLTISVPSFHLSTPSTPITSSPKPLSAPLLSPWTSHSRMHHRNLSGNLDPFVLVADDKLLDLPPSTPMQTSLNLTANGESSRSNSPVDEMPMLLAQLQRGSDSVATVRRLEHLTHNEHARSVMAMTPELYPQFERLLSTESSDVKELTAACLMNLTWDDPGRYAVTNYPDLLPPLVKLLWLGSSMARENAARCINRLATIEKGQKLILRQDDIILAFANLLHRWSSPKEKEQSAKCFACLSCIEDGQRAIIEEANIVATLLNALPDASADAKENIMRCLANLATNPDCLPKLLGHPQLVVTMRGFLTPNASILETEQAIRCIQYLAYSSTGQMVVISDNDVLDVLPRLLMHESLNIRKHAAACCRNLCQTLHGANRIFLQRELAYNLKSLLLSGQRDARKYVIEIFERTMENSVKDNSEVRPQSIPFRHDRQSFLLVVEELLDNQPPSRELCVRYLRKLCSESTSQDSVQWMLEISDRPALLLSLSRLTTGDLIVQREAALCLASVSSRNVGKVHAFLSTSGLLDELARAIQLGVPETKKAIAECLTNLAKTENGKQILRNHTTILAALNDLTQNQLTHSEIKTQANACLQIINPVQNPKRLSLFRRIF